VCRVVVLCDVVTISMVADHCSKDRLAEKSWLSGMVRPPVLDHMHRCGVGPIHSHPHHQSCRCRVTLILSMYLFLSGFY
jgi:hypothetical protein